MDRVRIQPQQRRLISRFDIFRDELRLLLFPGQRNGRNHFRRQSHYWAPRPHLTEYRDKAIRLWNKQNAANPLTAEIETDLSIILPWILPPELTKITDKLEYSCGGCHSELDAWGILESPLLKIEQPTLTVSISANLSTPFPRHPSAPPRNLTKQQIQDDFLQKDADVDTLPERARCGHNLWGVVFGRPSLAFLWSRLLPLADNESSH